MCARRLSIFQIFSILRDVVFVIAMWCVTKMVIWWTCRASATHVAPDAGSLSTKDLPWNERDCKRKIHNETLHEEPRGFTAFSSGDSSMRLSWARTIARVARPPVLTTCSFIVDAIRGTNVSLLITRYEPALKHCCARVRHRPLLRRYRTIQVPWLSRDTVPFYAGSRCEIQLTTAMTYCDFIKTSSSYLF